MDNETTERFVILKRVSTNKQGQSGLGLDAQQRDIDLFLSQIKNPVVVEELIEVQSGGNNDRPILEKALQICRKTKSQLLVSKVDRLTRDLETLARIVKDKTVKIRIASLPNADNFQIHLFGCLASQEKEFVSLRTKAALAAFKKKHPDRKLGNPNIAQMNKIRKNEARRFAEEHSGLIGSLRKKGKTLREICVILNDADMKTRNGGSYHPIQVSRILKRSLVCA